MRKEYLRSVAEIFISEHKTELKDFCFVFPNKRSSLFFKKYLSESSDVPVFSPEFTTINELFGRLSQLVVLDKITLMYRLHLCFTKVIDGYQESFDDFLYWGDMILNDFDDIDKYLADPQKLFSNINDLREIDSHYEYMSEEQIKAIETFWGVLLKYKDGGKEKEFVSMWSSLYRVYKEFNDSLSKDGSAYEGAVYRRVAEGIVSGDSHIEDLLGRYSRIVFVGMNALNNCEKILFDKLQQEGIADFYWDYYGSVITDSFNRSSMFMGSNVKRYPSRYAIDHRGGIPEEKPSVKLISVPSAVGGAKYVYNILKEILSKENTSDLTNTAIVLPDEKLLFPLLNTIPQEIEHINVTMGYSLSNSSISSFIWAVSSLQEKIRTKGGRYCFYYKGVMELLSNSFIKSIFPEECKTLREKILSDNMIYVSEDFLSIGELFEAIFHPLCSTAEDGLFESHTIAEYMTNVVEHCSEYADKVDREFLLGFLRCFNLLGTLPLRIRKETFFRMLRQVSTGVSIPFSGEPLQGLQIMGPLETRCLDFENIIVLSMNDGVFPSNTVSTSMIPYNLRRGFQLPTYEFQDSISAYHFYRSIARARNIYFIHDSRSEGLRSSELSRYILQMEYHHHFDIDKQVVQYDLRPCVQSDHLVFEKDEDTLSILRGLKYSATALSAYRKCPIQFYLRYVKGISEQEELSEEVDSGTFGNIFHFVMENIYKEYPNSESSGSLVALANNSAYISEWVAEGFRQKLGIDDLEGKNTLVALLIADYVRQTLLTDSKRVPFKVVATEGRYTTQYKVDGLPLELTLKGLVDRIDFKEGHYWVSDYKTGQMPANNKDGISPEHLFQLNLYLLILHSRGVIQEPASSILSIYYTRDIYSHKIHSTPVDMECYREFKNDLNAIFTELFDKEIPFVMCENVKECENCSFKEICNRK